jgi:hypothetical protein
MLAHYRVEAKSGEGGMGAIYQMPEIVNRQKYLAPTSVQLSRELKKSCRVPQSVFAVCAQSTQKLLARSSIEPSSLRVNTLPRHEKSETAAKIDVCFHTRNGSSRSSKLGGLHRPTTRWRMRFWRRTAPFVGAQRE